MRPTYYMILSSAGAKRDLSIDTREQPYWDEHAAHIDSYIANGMIVLGGPLIDEGGAILVVKADDEAAVRAMLDADPWYEHEILKLEWISRWQVFINEGLGS